MRLALKKRCFILITVLLTLTAATAVAAKLDLGFGWETEGMEFTVDVTQNSGGDCLLCLPGATDVTRLTTRLSGRDIVLWDGQPLQSGDAVDLSGSVGKTVTVASPDGIRICQVKVMQGSRIKSVFVDLLPEDLERIHMNKKLDIRNDGSMRLLNEDGSLAFREDFSSFHVRGNTTAFPPKKPYQVKLKNKHPVGDLPSSKTWLLLANWFDVSLMRNQITLDLCRELGLNGTPRGEQTDLYINGAYQGVYYLCEKIQIKKNRLNITDMEDFQTEAFADPDIEYRLKTSKDFGVPVLKWHQDFPEPEDPTGGFLLEIEKALQFSKNKESGGFMTDGGMCVLVKEPSYVSFESVKYLSRIVNNFHNAAIAPDGICPETGEYYTDFIDVDSFAVKVIVEEVSCNYDMKAASQFMYKDSDKKDSLLHAGPAWDYDLTYGNKLDKGQHDPELIGYIDGKVKNSTNLYRLLLQHDNFAVRTRELYLEKAVPLLKILTGEQPVPEGSCFRSIDEIADQIRASAEMNFSRWNAGAIGDLYSPSGRTFEDAVAYLKNFISLRTDALAEKWLVK